MNDDEKFQIRLMPVTRELCPPPLMDEIALSLRTVEPEPLSSNVWYGIDVDDVGVSTGRLIFTLRGVSLKDDPKVLSQFAMYFERPLSVLHNLKLNQCQFVPYPERGVLPAVFIPEASIVVYVKRDHTHGLQKSATLDATLSQIAQTLNFTARQSQNPKELYDVVSQMLQHGFDGSAFTTTGKLLDIDPNNLPAHLARMFVLDRLCLHEAAIWRGEYLRSIYGPEPGILAQLASAYAFAGQSDVAEQFCIAILDMQRSDTQRVSQTIAQQVNDIMSDITVDRKRQALAAAEE